MTGTWTQVSISPSDVDVGDEVLVIPSWYIVDEVEDDTLFCMGDDGEEMIVERKNIDGANRWVLDHTLAHVKS